MTKNYEAKDIKKNLNDIKKELKEKGTNPEGAWDQLKDVRDFLDSNDSKASDYKKVLAPELAKKDSRGFLYAGEGKDIKESVNDSKDFKDIDVEPLDDNRVYLLDEKKNEYKPLDSDYVIGIIDKVIK